MLTPRLNTSSGSAWYHFTARASGYWDEIVFDNDSRANFVRILNEVADLCTVKVLDYVVMGNHVHVVVCHKMLQDEINAGMEQTPIPCIVVVVVVFIATPKWIDLGPFEERFVNVGG